MMHGCSILSHSSSFMIIIGLIFAPSADAYCAIVDQGRIGSL
jgi:hypothetical protein